MGAVLLQKDNNGKWHLIDYISEGMNSAEWNYQIYDKEMMSIIRAFKEWSKWLLSAPDPIEVWTNHQNLLYFRKPQDLNGRQARWLMQLQNYNYTLHHIKGKNNGHANLLSCRPGHDQGQDDNKNVTMIKPKHLRVRNIIAIRLDSQLEKHIKEATKRTPPDEVS